MSENRGQTTTFVCVRSSMLLIEIISVHLPIKRNKIAFSNDIS